MINEALTNSQSLTHFRKKLKGYSLQELIRNKKMTGVIHTYKNNKNEVKTRKYRFKTLGLAKEYERLLEREGNLLQREMVLEREGISKQKKKKLILIEHWIWNEASFQISYYIKRPKKQFMKLWQRSNNNVEWP